MAELNTLDEQGRTRNSQTLIKYLAIVMGNENMHVQHKRLMLKLCQDW